jgi:hypothetical protein
LTKRGCITGRKQTQQEKAFMHGISFAHQDVRFCGGD